MSLRFFIILIGILFTGCWLLLYFWRKYQQKKLEQQQYIIKDQDSHYEDAYDSKNRSEPQIQRLKKDILLNDPDKETEGGLFYSRVKTRPDRAIKTLAEKQEDAIEVEKHDKNINPKDLVIVNLKARHAHGFNGRVLLDIFASKGLYFGDMDIFHKHILFNGKKRLVCSVANGKEPGHLQPEHLKENNLSCLVIFLNLATSYSPAKAYNEMVNIAQFISQELDGELYDGQMSVLTKQTIEHQKEQIMEIQRHRQIHKIS